MARKTASGRPAHVAFSLDFQCCGGNAEGEAQAAFVRVIGLPVRGPPYLPVPAADVLAQLSPTPQRMTPMKSLLPIGALSLALYLPGQALAWGLPVKVDAGINARFNVYWADQLQRPLAPWYLYWPMSGHFQTPAPVGGLNYPNWPGQWPPPAPPAPADDKAGPTPLLQPGPGDTNLAPVPGQPPAGATPPPPPGIVPAYYPAPYAAFPMGAYGQAPGYWYGR
jgi:hypothetical protein